MAAMLYMDIRQNLDIIGADHGTVTQSHTRGTFHKAFIGNVSICPLIYPDKASAKGLRSGDGVLCGVGHNIHTDGQIRDSLADSLADDGNAGGSFRPQILRLNEGDVSGVFNQQTVYAAFLQLKCFIYCVIVNILQTILLEFRGPGQGQRVNHADNRLFHRE